MHEASIVEFALDAVEKAARAHGMTRVCEVTLTIGKIKVAIPEILQSSFKLLTMDTMCDGATLVIDERPARIHCEDCGADSQIDDLRLDHCPVCGSHRTRVTGGNELLISSFKGY